MKQNNLSLKSSHTISSKDDVQSFQVNELVYIGEVISTVLPKGILHTPLPQRNSQKYDHRRRLVEAEGNLYKGKHIDIGHFCSFESARDIENMKMTKRIEESGE